MCLPSATHPIVVGASFDAARSSLGRGTRACLAAAADLARCSRSELEIVHAVEVPLSTTGRARLLLARNQLCASGIPARVTFHPESPERALCATALECDAGLIMVGGSVEAATALCRGLQARSAYPVLALCHERGGLVLLAVGCMSTAQACGRLLDVPTRQLAAG